MQVFHKIAELQNTLFDERKQGRSVGLVPTMGALHEGHASLVKKSVTDNDVTVVSVFVNPTQFNDPKDLSSYPRDLEADCRLLESVGADYVFAPSVEEMAPIDELDGDYLVKTKKTTVTQSGEYNWFIYEYELTNSFDVENEINYFDNQRAKANGNISQGEYVARNVDVENTANIIFSNLQITELTIDGDNTLEAGLEMPLVG